MPLSRERNTIERGTRVHHLSVAANTRIMKGAIVALEAGLAKPGATAANLVAAGVAFESVDNTGGADGAKLVRVERGAAFLFKNAAADPLTGADLFKDCFVVDDETVAKTNGGNTRSRAGIVRGVDPNGVWVEF